MQVNNISQTNFKGGFKFPQMPTGARNELCEFITTKKQIFDNFKKSGDVFLVTRDKTNFKVAEFIRKHKLKFEFYPTINTKCQLDTQNPEGLETLLDSIKEAPITTMSQLRKILTRQKRNSSIEIKSPSYTDKILKALCIDNKHPVKNIKGATVIEDNEFNRKIFFSPPSKLNIHYVKVSHSSVDKGAELYAIDSEGNILNRYSTPDGIKIFNQRFKNSLVK